MLRVVEELLYAVRREGLVVSTAQAIDCARIFEMLGWDDKASLRSALATVIVDRREDRARFDTAFDRFFAPEGPHPGDLFARLVASGFTEAEVLVVRELLERTADTTVGGGLALRALLGASSELDHVLSIAGVRAQLDPVPSPSRVGFFTERAALAIGIGAAGTALRAIRRALVDALGERGAALADALDREIALMKRRVRAHVEEIARAAAPEVDGAAPAFATLSAAESIEMRRAVRRIADKLRGREAVRRRRALRGRVDAARTVRRAFATGGVPLELLRKKRRRARPKLVVLCDVSESVRSASSFMLEFVALAQDLFAGARSFVFVSDVGETTELFDTEPAGRALGAIAAGRVVNLASTSNYGRAFASFEALVGKQIDRRTTIAILGDGRTNHKYDGLEALQRIRRRARGILWICPEARSHWGSGDSAMTRYARVATSVIEARTVRDLEVAARTLIAFR